MTLKPTKTRDKSTAAFIKKSSTPVNSEVSQTNGCNDDASIDGMKDALQEELRNTLKRKVKKQDVERGDPTKNHEIEKKIEVKRTDVELKVNNTSSDAGKSSSLLPPPKPARSMNGNSQTAELVKSPSATQSPSRTTILDTKIPNTLRKPVTSPKATPNDPSKKLLISHPKASFTLPRSNTRKAQQTEPTASKPVFRILTDLEQAEQRQEKEKIPSRPRADSPGAEPVLNSYVSFAKELANAPNNYPDTVTKTTTVGTLQEDLFYGNTNLRDIKIDIVENGQCKVVSK
ncbi:hypothetical protein quinque_005566 [Culex quinquefasciatus]